jgi:hypothetical protein
LSRVPGEQATLEIPSKESGFPQSGWSRNKVHIYDLGIRKSQTGAGVVDETRLKRSQLLWKPVIVLIAEGNKIPVASLNGFFKITGRTQVLAMYVKLYRKGCRPYEVVNDP